MHSNICITSRVVDPEESKSTHTFKNSCANIHVVFDCRYIKRYPHQASTTLNKIQNRRSCVRTICGKICQMTLFCLTDTFKNKKRNVQNHFQGHLECHQYQLEFGVSKAPVFESLVCPLAVVTCASLLLLPKIFL